MLASTRPAKPTRPNFDILQRLGLINSIDQPESRNRVSNEILLTEKTYINDLKLVIEGYFSQMLLLPSIKPEELKILFSNIQEIYDFHLKLMANMELITKMNGNVSLAFLGKKKKWIELYTTYCSNHDEALKLVANFNSRENMKAFLLGCKLLVSQEISLEGFLLCPVQRLCRYPLLLKELLKTSTEDSPCYKETLESLELMKDITRLVNDTKKNQENAKLLEDFRDKIEGLANAEKELNVKNKFMIHKQVVLKISNGRAQERHLFLLDKMLVYEKENPVKKGTFQLKGRILITNFSIEDIPSPSSSNSDNNILKFAWNIMRNDIGKKYTIVNRSLKDKNTWIEEIRKAQESAQEVFSVE